MGLCREERQTAEVDFLQMGSHSANAAAIRD